VSPSITIVVIFDPATSAPVDGLSDVTCNVYPDCRCCEPGIPTLIGCATLLARRRQVFLNPYAERRPLIPDVNVPGDRPERPSGRQIGDGHRH
jgi:hypothetical protein